MADGATFDFSQITLLTADLGKAPLDAGPNIYKAVTVTSAKIKKAWQGKLSGTPNMPKAPLSITYDVGANVSIFRQARSGIPAEANQIVSEIGAEDGRLQATFVALFEYGAPVNAHGGTVVPHGYGAASLQENSDDFQSGLELAIGDPLGQSTETGAAVSESSTTETR